MRAIDQDAAFFQQHPDRWAHIRTPGRVLVRDRQRAVSYQTECEGEFWSLGPHNHLRRRIILWRVPPDNPFYNPAAPQILKIPFLLFSDEAVEDRDDILLPIIHQLMMNEKAKMEQKAHLKDLKHRLSED
ncbi:MAG: hypothetical protein C5B50_00675 [Verrucomicrobia bacterium]|nr:MAG: hypothetical protein C5B50_00675 [Verrucomicrobiota bacterium]